MLNKLITIRIVFLIKVSFLSAQNLVKVTTGAIVNDGGNSQSCSFSSGISTNLDKSDLRQTFFNLGLQLDFRMVLFSNLASILSFGFAGAIEENQSPKDANTEFIVSLKIL